MFAENGDYSRNRKSGPAAGWPPPRAMQLARNTAAAASQFAFPQY
jgi:hypothetical protein